MYWAALTVTLALLVSAFVTWREAGSKGYNQERFLDLMFAVGLGSFFLAHLSLVLLRGPFFLRDAIIFWQGDYLLFGGLWGGISLLMWLTRRWRWPTLEVGDILIPGLILTHSLAPLSCYFGVCNRDTYFVESAFWFLIFYLLAHRGRFFRIKTVPKGLLMYAYLTLVPVFYLVLDKFSPVLRSEDRQLGFALLVGSVIAWLYRLWSTRKKGSEELPLALTFRNLEAQRKMINPLEPITNISNAVTVLPQKFIKQMKIKLQRQEKRLKEELKLLEKEDPFKDQSRVNDNAEVLTESLEQSVHNFVDMQRKFIRDSLRAIRDALGRMAKGTYGLSIKSGKPIPPERLEAKPSADLTVEEEEERERREAGRMPPMERIQ